jgi:TetR/AcrR family transcriptional regulator
MSTSERREREKARRRQGIVDIAEEMFIERGYDGVSMEEVAKKTDLAIGTLYLYFKNKESLFCAVVLRAASELNAMFIESVKHGRTGAEKLDATGQAYYEFYRKSPGRFRLYMFYSQSPGFAADTECAQEIKRLGKDNFRLGTQCIEEGMADGSLRKGLDPIRAALFGIIALQNIISLSPEFEAIFKAAGLSHEDFIIYARGLIARSVRADSDEKGKTKEN